MSSVLNIICRLGAFHTIMSFLGSIGSIMDGSGLSDAMQCCYGPNAVTHIISGKAVERAVRAHFLTESALFALLLEDQFDLSLGQNTVVPEREIRLSAEDMGEVETLYQNVASGSINFNDIGNADCLGKLNESIEASRQALKMCRMANCGFNTYNTLIFLNHSFVLKERAIGLCIFIPCIACLIYLQPQGIITMPNQLACICSS